MKTEVKSAFGNKFSLLLLRLQKPLSAGGVLFGCKILSRRNSGLVLKTAVLFGRLIGEGFINRRILVCFNERLSFALIIGVGGGFAPNFILLALVCVSFEFGFILAGLLLLLSREKVLIKGPFLTVFTV